MITAWTKNCKTEEEKKRLILAIEGSKTAFKRLSEILDEEAKRLDRSEMDVRVYDNPNWANLQAHKNGFRSCLQVVQNIIDLDPKEQND